MKVFIKSCEKFRSHWIYHKHSTPITRGPDYQRFTLWNIELERTELKRPQAARSEALSWNQTLGENPSDSKPFLLTPRILATRKEIEGLVSEEI